MKRTFLALDSFALCANCQLDAVKKIVYSLKIARLDHCAKHVGRREEMSKEGPMTPSELPPTEIEKIREEIDLSHEERWWESVCRTVLADRDRLAARVKELEDVIQVLHTLIPESVEPSTIVIQLRVSKLAERLARVEGALEWICLYDGNHAATPAGAAAIKSQATQALEGKTENGSKSTDL